MLPILVSTPHCSGEVPEDILRAMLATGESEASLRSRLLREGDPYTDAIFRLPEAGVTVNATVSRFVADLNRARGEGGENGVIKVTDFQRRPFYPAGFVLEPEERERRLDLYYDPYHAALADGLAGKNIRCFLDGHSMTARGPAIGPDRGKPRPAVCVGNFGDADGETAAEGPVSCPPALARRVRDRCRELLAGLPAEPGVPREVLLNQPFDGGHILRTYSRPPYSVPGLMIEINRALYLDERTLQPLPGRVEWLREAMGTLAGFLLSELEAGG